MQTQTVNLQLDRPFPWQRQVMRECRRFNVAAIGRRAGKSTMAYELMLRPALAGYPVGYFAPTYKLLGETWRALARLARPISRSMNASDHRIELLTGGVIEMWTLEDPNAGRSRKYMRTIVDEAGLCADLGERWHAAILPTLADYQGDAWLLGTPKGRNFFWQVWQWGQDPLRPDWISWQMPTTVNPNIKASEIAMLRQSMPEMTYQQEIEAVFLEGEGAVFRNIIANLTAPADATPDQHIGHTFVAGVDWGQRNDFTAISVVCRECLTEVLLDRFNKIEWSFQRGRLRTAYDLWNVYYILAEANSIGSPNIEALQGEGMEVVSFETTASSKPPLIMSLALALEREEVKWLDVPVATAELNAYESKASSTTGRLSYSAPAGMHDDTVMARALALEAAISPLPVPNGIVTYDERVTISAY